MGTWASHSTLLGLSFPIYNKEGGWKKWSLGPLTRHSSTNRFYCNFFLLAPPPSPRGPLLCQTSYAVVWLSSVLYLIRIYIFSYYCVIIYKVSHLWCLKSFITPSLLVSRLTTSSAPSSFSCYHAPNNIHFWTDCVVTGRNLSANYGLSFLQGQCRSCSSLQ